jgi:hypothetical protein
LTLPIAWILSWSTPAFAITELCEAKSRRTVTHVSQDLAPVWPKCANQT